MEGDCYLLASKYLSTKDIAYIISDGIRGKYCTWNFKGNTDADFSAWCKREGLVCQGNPFYVGYDSVWYQGQFMPHQKAIYLQSVRDSADREKNRLDSSRSALSLPPLPVKNVVIEYLELGRSVAEKIGFNYSDYIGGADFWHYNDLFSLLIQAQDIGDTTFIYRTYSSVYDSTLHVFWGGSRDRLTQSNVTSTGIVSNNYEQESYGLTLDIDNMKYDYTHATDYEHSISGKGLLEWGENIIVGIYQYDYQKVSSLPFLGSLPWFGFLFRHVDDLKETRYVFIRIVVGLPDLEV